MQESPLQPTDAPARIRAITGPPGSGKSTRLVQEALDLGQPALILAVSPLNRRRLEGYVSALSQGKPHAVNVMTLEGFLLACLQANGEASARLLEDVEATWLVYGLLEECAAEYRLPTSMALAHCVYDWMRPLLHAGIGPDQLDAACRNRPGQWLSHVYGRFLNAVEEQQCIPHAALTDRLHKSFQRDPETVRRFRHAYQALFIDEAQELSALQHDLLYQLNLPLVLAGDPSLSIRSLRGAAPERLARISDTERLSGCHRGNADVVHLASRLLGKDPVLGEPLAASRCNVCRGQDVADEAETLAQWILRTRKHAMVMEPNGTGRPARWADFMILLRSARYRGALLETFRRLGIPLQEAAESEPRQLLPLALYDLLCAFEALAAGATERANRHLRRWGAMLHPDATATIPSDTENLLLEQWPAAVRENFQAWHAAYRAEPWISRLGRRMIPALDPAAERWLEDLHAFEARHRDWLKRPVSSEALQLWMAQRMNEDAVTDGVRLLSCHQVQGEEAPFVAIPFLVAEEWPQTRLNTELMEEPEREALGRTLQLTLPPGRADEAEEARLLTMALTRARQEVFISCHQADGPDTVQPSIFFEKLARSGSGYNHSEPDTSAGRLNFEGASAWSRLAVQEAEPLFAPDETLYLSASHLKTWMTCPRQFYYKHLLKLSSGDSPEATLGSLIHKLLEVFNRKRGDIPHTAESLQQLADQMFGNLADPEAFVAAGFDERDLWQLNRLSPLARHDLRQRLAESIADLEAKGYFRRYANARAVHPEKELLGVTVEGIENCQFKMALDAVVQLEDGDWEIIDYKTYRSAYSTAGPDTCQLNFQKTLDPLPGGDDIRHAERFRSKLSRDYPKDYQLPLYYLAARQQPEYGDNLRGVALQIIRPGFEEAPQQGSIRLELPADAIEAHKRQLTTDINRYLIEPIRGSTAFATNPDNTACAQCGFADICDATTEEEA